MLVTRFWTELNGTANTHYPLLPLEPPLPPHPQKIKDETAQKPKCANFPSLVILDHSAYGFGRRALGREWSLIWGSRGYKFSIYFVQGCNLGTHIPPIQGWNRAKAKTRQFPIIGEGKGGGVQIFHLFCPSRCSKLKARGEDLGNKGLL